MTQSMEGAMASFFRWHGPHENDVLLKMLKDENWCQPIIEIAYDQWCQVTISCNHGKFQSVSNFLNLTEAYRRACRVFNEHPHTPKCYLDCDPPASWKEGDDDDAQFWRENQTECDLLRGHEGNCRAFDDNDPEEKAMRNRIYR